MEKMSIAAVLQSLFIVLATSGFGACTKSDKEAAGSAGFSSAYAAYPAVPLYPPLHPDAKDGHVHEYY
jgi:hypothetical protein